MGKPASIIYKGQEIQFCCPDCVKDFKKDPDKFLKKMAEEVKKAKK
jgi:YHS domain-containing protein